MFGSLYGFPGAGWCTTSVFVCAEIIVRLDPWLFAFLSLSSISLTGISVKNVNKQWIVLCHSCIMFQTSLAPWPNG